MPKNLLVAVEDSSCAICSGRTTVVACGSIHPSMCSSENLEASSFNEWQDGKTGRQTWARQTVKAGRPAQREKARGSERMQLIEGVLSHADNTWSDPLHAKDKIFDTDEMWRNSWASGDSAQRRQAWLHTGGQQSDVDSRTYIRKEIPRLRCKILLVKLNKSFDVIKVVKIEQLEKSTIMATDYSKGRTVQECIGVVT